MYFVSLHGQATSVCPGSSGAPMECSAGTKSASSPNASSTATPIRVMIRIEATTYGLSVISTPNMRGRRVERAHTERDHVHRPAAHTAAVQLGQDPFHLGRVHPVVGRPGVGRVDRADERALLDPRHIGRIGARPERVRPPRRIEPDQGSRADHVAGETSPFVLRNRRTTRCARVW